jgi:hypothetical protein
MANIASQIKRNRQTVKLHAANQGVRSELKTRIKKAVDAAPVTPPSKDEAFRRRSGSTPPFWVWSTSAPPPGASRSQAHERLGLTTRGDNRWSMTSCFTLRPIARSTSSTNLTNGEPHVRTDRRSALAR